MSEQADDAQLSRQITVFLLDDHEVVRRGVRDMVESESDLEVVGEASTAAEALARCARTAAGRRDPRRTICLTATASPCAATCGRKCPSSSV